MLVVVVPSDVCGVVVVVGVADGTLDDKDEQRTEDVRDDVSC